MEKDKNLEFIFKEIKFVEPSVEFTERVMKNSFGYNNSPSVDRKQMIALTSGLISFVIILSTIITLFAQGYFISIPELLTGLSTYLYSKLSISLPNIAFILIMPFIFFRILIVLLVLNNHQLKLVKK